MMSNKAKRDINWNQKQYSKQDRKQLGGVAGSDITLGQEVTSQGGAAKPELPAAIAY